MTHKGESLTAKGENEPKKQLIDTDPFRILFYWRKDDLPGQVFEISGASDSDALPVCKPQAHMVFSIESDTGNIGQVSTSTVAPFKRYEHNIILFKSQDIFKQWRRGAQTELLCISVNIDFLTKYLPLQNKAFSRFCNALENEKPAVLSKNHLTINPRIAAVLNDILNCKHLVFYKKLYLEAKIIELLTLQFEQYELSVSNTVASDDTVSESVADKMNEVKNILINDINTTLSLKELAHKVGTNEHTLKSAFKKLFGNTVFGYLHQIKMEKARQMLLQKDVRIAEVSNHIGYKHATHFTTAFKKYFGYLPNKILLLFFVPFVELQSLLMLLNFEYLIVA